MKTKKRTSQRGVGLVLVMLVLVMLMGAVTLLGLRVHSSKRFTDVSVTGAQLDEICKAGVDLGVDRLWHQYVVNQGNTTGNYASYQLYLNSVLGVATNEDLNNNGVRDGDESDSNGNGNFDTADPLALIDEPYPLPSGGVVESVLVSRCDDLTGSDLTLEVVGAYKGQRQRAIQTLRIGGKPFTGFDYAVLANNINCILCHAEFLPLDLDRNTNPDLYGTFDRIKIACLESLLFRTGEADSQVAGTVYTRGDVYNQYGSPLSASQLASSSFTGYSFSDTNGKLYQDASTGSMSSCSLVNADTDEEGELNQFANLYKDYPEDPNLQKDGDLPLDFPAPFPDLNNNRYVDDTEFLPIMNAAAGSISNGVAFGVPNDGGTPTLYEGDALPTSSNEALNDLATTGTYDGNLILVGTDEQPIQIDGDVVVNGDLVLKGTVKGFGQLMVRGNAYVVGDVTYADAPGEFGLSNDGTVNGLALTTGGSILMGDYLTIRGKSHTDDGSKYPDKAYSIQYRDEHVTGSISKNGDTQVMQYGYFDPGAIDAGAPMDTMFDADGNEVQRQGQQFSFTTSELMLFNNMELEKALADPNYTPRFYGLRESQPNSLYVYDSSDEHAVRYDEGGNTVQTISDYLLGEGMSATDVDALLARAAKHYMNPEANWIAEETLREMWWNDEMTRPSSRRPFQFDGLLYTNNAIFALTHSYARHGSHTSGKMRIRGAVVCPDLGVLVPANGGSDTGLSLYYDRRVSAFLAVEDKTEVVCRRQVYRRMRIASAEQS